MENIPQIKINEGGDASTVANKVEKSIYQEDAKPHEETVLIPKLANQKKTDMKEMKPKRKVGKWLGILGICVLILIIIASVMGFLSFQVYKKGIIFKNALYTLADSGKSKDLQKIKSNISTTKNTLGDLQKSYNNLSFVKPLPFVGAYYKDGEHGLNAAKNGLDAADIVVGVVEPYADIIGLSGGSKSTSGMETAQDRIDFIIKTIPGIIPKIDDLSVKVNAVKEEVDQIDPQRYPEKFKGIVIRQQLIKGIEAVDLASNLIVQGKPIIESTNYLLGIDSPRQYLVLFQNDKELRPTGGFLTAYSVAKVEKGMFQPVYSDDIYHLDSKYTPSIAAPDPFVKYLKGPYVSLRKYRLRDMNWSPDFSVSMELFTQEAKKAGIGNIDGVIVVDTQLLVNLLDVVGPIGVPGYGEYSTKIVPQCNCPQVIYELESFADIEGPVVWSQDDPGKIIFAPPNYDNRKKIIGPLMNSILANTMGQPKDKLPNLFEAAIKSLTEKHVLFYLLDEKSQKAIDAFGIGGDIKEYEGDYLHINDANLGGRKSNLYVTQEVNQEINVGKDGSVEKTLTVTYKNPEKQDGWLNSILPNWVRIYVPKGSQLISSEGLEDKVDPYEDLGKTVFAGFFNLRPQGVVKLTFKYKLPFKVGKDYQLMIQKQPGTDAPLYTVKIGKNEEEFSLKGDKELRFKI